MTERQHREAQPGARRPTLWRAANVAVAGAIASTLIVRAVALAFIDVPPEFPPLATPGPTIFFSAVLSIAAVLVYALVRRWSARPDARFRVIALAALLLSFVPDVWLLSDGAARAVPGATPAAVGILMTMHVAAAGVVVWALTGGTAKP